MDRKTRDEELRVLRRIRRHALRSLEDGTGARVSSYWRSRH
jgi:hypothetical protein